MVDEQVQVEEQLAQPETESSNPPKGGYSKKALLRLYGDVSRSANDLLGGVEQDAFVDAMYGNMDAQREMEDMLLGDEQFASAKGMPATKHELFSDLEAYYPDMVAGMDADSFADLADENPEYLGQAYDLLAKKAPLVVGRTDKESFLGKYSNANRSQGLSHEEVEAERDQIMEVLTKGTKNPDGTPNYDRVVVSPTGNNEEAARIRAEEELAKKLAERSVEELEPEELHDLIKGKGSYAKRQERAERYQKSRDESLASESDAIAWSGVALTNGKVKIAGNWARGFFTPIEMDAEIVRKAKDLESLNAQYPDYDITPQEFLSVKGALLAPDQMAASNEARMLGTAAKTYKQRGEALRAQVIGEVEGLTEEKYEELTSKLAQGQYLSLEDQAIAKSIQTTSAFKGMQQLQVRYDEIENRFNRIDLETREIAAFEKYKEELAAKESKGLAEGNWAQKRLAEMGQYFGALAKAPEKLESTAYSFGSALRIDYFEQSLAEMESKVDARTLPKAGQWDREAVSRSMSYTAPDGNEYEIDYDGDQVTGAYDAKTGEPVTGEALEALAENKIVAEGYKNASLNINGSSAMAMASSTLGDITIDFALAAATKGRSPVSSRAARLSAAGATIANHWGTATLQAMKAGNLDPENAAIVGLSDAVLESTMEIATGRVSSLAQVGASKVTNRFGRSSATAAQVRASIGQLTKGDKAREFFESSMKALGGELFEETLTNETQGIRNAAANAMLGGEYEDTGMSSAKERWSTVLVTAMATALPGTLQGYRDMSSMRKPGFFRDAAMKLINDERSKTTFIDTIDKLAVDGKVTQAEADGFKEAMLGLASDMEGVLSQVEGVEDKQSLSKVDDLAGVAMELRMVQVQAKSNPADKKLSKRAAELEAELVKEYTVLSGLLNPNTAQELQDEIDNLEEEDTATAEEIEDSFEGEPGEVATEGAPTDDAPQEGRKKPLSAKRNITVQDEGGDVVSTLSVPMIDLINAAKNNGGSVKVGIAGGREGLLVVGEDGNVSLELGVSGSLPLGSIESIYSRFTDDFRITGVSRNNDNSESASYVKTKDGVYAVAFSDPAMAIDYDEDGNVLGVDLYKLTRNTEYYNEENGVDVKYDRQYVTGDEAVKIARALEARSLVGLRASQSFLDGINTQLDAQTEAARTEIQQKLANEQAETERLIEQGKITATGGTTPAEGGSTLNADLGPDGSRVTANDESGDSGTPSVQPEAGLQQDQANPVPQGQQPAPVNNDSGPVEVPEQTAPSETTPDDGEGGAPEVSAEDGAAATTEDGAAAAAEDGTAEDSRTNDKGQVEGLSISEQIARSKRERDYEVLSDRARKTALANIAGDKTKMPEDPRSLNDDKIPNRIIIAGVTITRPPIIDGKVLGATVPMIFGDNHTMVGRWRVAEADDLYQSHETDGKWSQKFFNQPMQPKDRGDDNSKTRRMKIARDLKPSNLAKDAVIYFGSPVVNHRGEVIQGNNRTGAIKDAYAYKDAEAYRKWIRDNAAEFGFTPEDVDSVKNPVLVREVILPDSEATLVGQTQVTDRESGNKGDLSDPRVVTSLRLGDAFAGLVNTMFQGLDSSKATVAKAVQKNKARIGRYLAQHVSVDFLGAFADGSTAGQIGQALEQVLIQGILGSMNFRYRALLDSLDSEARMGLILSLPALANLPKELSLMDVIPQAMRLAGEATLAGVNIGGIVGINKYLEQGSLVDAEVYSGAARAMAAVLLAPRSAAEVKKYFESYAQMVEPKGTLAIEAPPTRVQALNTLNQLIAATEYEGYREIIDGTKTNKERVEFIYGDYTQDALLKALPEVKESDFDPDFIEIVSQSIPEDTQKTDQDIANEEASGERGVYNDKEVIRAEDGSWRYANQDGSISGRKVAQSQWETLDQELLEKIQSERDQLKKQVEAEQAAIREQKEAELALLPEDREGGVRQVESNGEIYNYSNGTFEGVEPNSPLDAELRIKLERIEANESPEDSQLKSEATTATTFLQQVLSQITFKLDEATTAALTQLVTSIVAAKAIREGVSFDTMLKQLELVEVQDLGALEAAGADLSTMDVAELQGSPDPNAETIPRLGAFVKTKGGALRIIISPGANAGTILHELAHAFEGSLTEAERQSILEWAGHSEWTRETSESFAKGYELWLREGDQALEDEGISESTKDVFRKFAEYMKQVFAWATKNREFSPAVVDIYRDMSGLPLIGHSGKAPGMTSDGRIDAVHNVESTENDSTNAQDYSELTDREREFLQFIPPSAAAMLGYDATVAHVRHIQENIDTLLADPTYDGTPEQARLLSIEEINQKMLDRLAAKNSGSLFSTGLLTYNQLPASFADLQGYSEFAKTNPGRLLLQTAAGVVALSGDFSTAQLNEVFRILQPTGARYMRLDGTSSFFEKSKVDAAMRYNRVAPKGLGTLNDATGVTLLSDTGSLIGRFEIKDASKIGRLASALGAKSAYVDNADNTVVIPQNDLLHASLEASDVQSAPIGQADSIVTNNRYSAADIKVADAAVGVLMASPSIDIDTYAKMHNLDVSLTELIRQRLLDAGREGGQTKRAKYTKQKLAGREKLKQQAIIHMQNNPLVTLAEAMMEFGLYELGYTEQEFPQALRERLGADRRRADSFETERDSELIGEGLGLMQEYDNMSPEDMFVQLGSKDGWTDSISRILRDPNISPEVKAYLAQSAEGTRTINIENAQEIAERYVGSATSIREITILAANAVQKFKDGVVSLTQDGKEEAALALYSLDLLANRAATRGLPRLAAAILQQRQAINSNVGMSLKTTVASKLTGPWARIGRREAFARKMSLTQSRGGNNGMSFQMMSDAIWENAKLTTEQVAAYNEEIKERGRKAFNEDLQARIEKAEQERRTQEERDADAEFFKQSRFGFNSDGLSDSGTLFSTPQFQDLPLNMQQKLRERVLAAYWNNGLQSGRARQAFKKNIDPALADMWDVINAEPDIASQVFDLRVERDLNRMKRITDQQIAEVVAGKRTPENARENVLSELIKASKKRRTGDASGQNTVTADDYTTARKALAAKADAIMTLETAIEETQKKVDAYNNPSDLEALILLQDILATAENNQDTRSPAGMRRLINKELSANNRKYADLATDKILNNGVRGAIVKALMEDGMDAETAKLYEDQIRQAYDATVKPLFEKQAERAAFDAFANGLGLNIASLRAQIAVLERQKVDHFKNGDKKKAKIAERKIAKIKKSIDNAHRYAKDLIKKNKGKISTLTEMMAFGSFTDQGLPEHIASIFGHDVMSGGSLIQLERLTAAYDATKDPKEKRRLKFEIGKYLQETGTSSNASHKALTYYLEYVYGNMLSSFETAGAAIAGNLDTVINKVMVPETFRIVKSLINSTKSGDARELRFLFDAMKKAASAIPTGLKAWSDVIMTGDTDVNITDLDSKRLRSERPLFDVFKQAVLDYDKPGPYSKVRALAAALPAMVLAGQQLAVRTLYGVDAFSNIVVKPYIAERSAQYKVLSKSKRDIFRTVGYTSSELEMLDMIDDLMGRTSGAKQETADIIRVRKGQAPNAPVDTSTREYIELLAEVSESYMDEDIYRNATEMSQELAGMGTVFGPMGVFINPMINLKQSSLQRIQRYQEERLDDENNTLYGGKIAMEYLLQSGLAILMPFARVVGVMGGLAIKAQPLALLALKRDETGKLNWPLGIGLNNQKTEFSGLSPVQTVELNRYEAFANHILAVGPTMMGIMAMGMLFEFEADDDEEPVEGVMNNLMAGSQLVPREDAGIRVTGSGKGISYGRLTNLSGQGWKPYEVQKFDAETGRWNTLMSYRNSVVGGTLAWLGHITDSNEFESTINNDKNTSALAQIGYAPASFAQYVAQIGFVQSAETVGSAVDYIRALLSAKEDGVSTEIAKVRSLSSIMRPIVPGGNLGNYMEKVNQHVFGSSPKTGTLAGSRVAGDILSNSFFYSWAFDKSRYDPYGYEQVRPWRIEGTGGVIPNYAFGVNEEADNRPGRDFLNKYGVGNSMTPFYPQRMESTNFTNPDNEEGIDFTLRQGVTDEQILEMQDQSYQHRRAMLEALILKEDRDITVSSPKALERTSTQIRDSANQQAKAHQVAQLLEADPEWIESVEDVNSYLKKPKFPSGFVVRSDESGTPVEYDYSYMKRLMAFHGFRIDGDQVSRTKVKLPEGVETVKDLSDYREEFNKQIKGVLIRE